MSVDGDDSIFQNMHRPESVYRYGSERGIRVFLGDVFPLDVWQSEGCPVAVTNSIFVDPVINQDRIMQLPDSFYGFYYFPYALDHDAVPTRAYNCFMNRMDPIRQSWLYLLIRRGIFDRGYVSFNMEIERLPGCQGRNAHDVFQEHFEKYCGIFQAEHDWIRDRVPYRNFPSSPDLTATCYDSRFSIVLETYFDQNNIITYSEKTFRALQMPRAWLLFSHQHAVKYLRDKGFDTLDDMIDHDRYDRLASTISRQSTILDMATEMLDRDFDQGRLRQAAGHNQQLMQSYSQRFEIDCMATIDRAVEYKYVAKY